MTLLWVARAAAFWATLHAPPPPYAPEPEPRPWRLLDRDCTHLGLRPASDGSGVALTLQLSVCWLP